MMRTPIALVPWLLAIAAVIGGLLWHMGDLVQTTGAASVGGPFALTDQNGQTRTDRDFRGRLMLVYFGYTNCPDVCPTTLAEMGDALGQLGGAGKRIAPIFITVDPARDTPRVLKTYVKSFGQNFIGLTGNAKAIADVAREYRVYFRKQDLPTGGYAMDHSSTIYLMGPDGKFLDHYDESIGPDGLAAALKTRL
jgi:cytochrome oxidase Cu insertion factor (SCO1/SenC/PrrC family)